MRSAPGLGWAQRLALHVERRAESAPLRLAGVLQNEVSADPSGVRKTLTGVPQPAHGLEDRNHPSVEHLVPPVPSAVHLCPVFLPVLSGLAHYGLILFLPAPSRFTPYPFVLFLPVLICGP